MGPLGEEPQSDNYVMLAVCALLGIKRAGYLSLPLFIPQAVRPGIQLHAAIARGEASPPRTIVPLSDLEDNVYLLFRLLPMLAGKKGQAFRLQVAFDTGCEKALEARENRLARHPCLAAVAEKTNGQRAIGQWRLKVLAMDRGLPFGKTSFLRLAARHAVAMPAMTDEELIKALRDVFDDDEALSLIPAQVMKRKSDTCDATLNRAMLSVSRALYTDRANRLTPLLRDSLIKLVEHHTADSSYTPKDQRFHWNKLKLDRRARDELALRAGTRVLRQLVIELLSTEHRALCLPTEDAAKLNKADELQASDTAAANKLYEEFLQLPLVPESRGTEREETYGDHTGHSVWTPGDLDSMIKALTDETSTHVAVTIIFMCEVLGSFGIRIPEKRGFQTNSLKKFSSIVRFLKTVEGLHPAILGVRQLTHGNVATILRRGFEAFKKVKTTGTQGAAANGSWTVHAPFELKLSRHFWLCHPPAQAGDLPLTGAFGIQCMPQPLLQALRERDANAGAMAAATVELARQLVSELGSPSGIDTLDGLRTYLVNANAQGRPRSALVWAASDAINRCRMSVEDERVALDSQAPPRHTFHLHPGQAP